MCTSDKIADMQCDTTRHCRQPHSVRGKKRCDSKSTARRPAHSEPSTAHLPAAIFLPQLTQGTRSVATAGISCPNTSAPPFRDTCCPCDMVSGSMHLSLLVIMRTSCQVLWIKGDNSCVVFEFAYSFHPAGHLAFYYGCRRPNPQEKALRILCARQQWCIQQEYVAISCDGPLQRVPSCSVLGPSLPRHPMYRRPSSRPGALPMQPLGPPLCDARGIT